VNIEIPDSDIPALLRFFHRGTANLLENVSDRDLDPKSRVEFGELYDVAIRTSNAIGWAISEQHKRSESDGITLGIHYDDATFLISELDAMIGRLQRYYHFSSISREGKLAYALRCDAAIRIQNDLYRSIREQYQENQPEARRDDLPHRTEEAEGGTTSPAAVQSAAGGLREGHRGDGGEPGEGNREPDRLTVIRDYTARVLTLSANFHEEFLPESSRGYIAAVRAIRQIIDTGIAPDRWK
jgi:hypothetical protein